MIAVPSTLEGFEIALECGKQIRFRTRPAAKLAVVVAIRFVFRKKDEVAAAEVREAGEIKGAQCEAKFAAVEELGGELEPALLGQLVCGHRFFAQVWRRGHRLGLRGR